MFACYDVGGRASLSMNELFLLLKSTSTGLCKLSGVEPPDSARLESIASLVRSGFARHGYLLPKCHTQSQRYTFKVSFDAISSDYASPYRVPPEAVG